MKFFKKIYIHPLTYFFILLFLLTGYIKPLLIILLVILTHELGHLIFLKLFKRKIEKVIILPFGGIIKLDGHISSDIYEEMLISIGGIFMQVILGLIYQDNFLLTEFNKSLILFNLLPIVPLDGGRIVKLIGELLLPYKLTFSISLIISLSTIIILLFVNFLLVRNNLILFSYIVFAVIIEYKNRKYMLNRFYLERLLWTFNFSKNKNIKKIEQMYKNRNNILNGLSEHDFLRQKFTM